MHPVKFSLLIPTRERAITLKSCLQTVVSQSYSNLEIIVSDNFSQDNTREVVESFNDPRIKYVNTGQRLSMSDNWEFGFSHATGDWFSILGDDDGLLPQCFESINQLIHQSQAKAIRTRACSFVWPQAQRPDNFAPLNVPMRKGWQIRSSKLWIKKVLNAHVNYSELPMLYNGGFVQMHVLQSFVNLHGRLFYSRIPDVYSGMLIGHLVDNFVYSYEPVVINGTSSFSTGYAHFKRKHIQTNTINDAEKQFLEEPNLAFHPSIPLHRDGNVPKSLIALSCEAYAQVADRLPQIKGINYSNQLATILAANTSMTTEESLQWIEDYQKVHRLTTITVNHLFWQKLWLRFKFLSYRVSLAWHSYSLELTPDAITNIHEASIAAFNIKSTRPPYRVNSLNHMLLNFKRAR
jgi:glycosyltransferase involved in cell wall biosynthesis